MLTAEQQKTIQDSAWVIDTVLGKLGLQKNEDIRQSLFLYMCKCIERYDSSRGTKWTTYAYKTLYLYALRIWDEEKKKSKGLVSIESVIQLTDNGVSERQMIEVSHFYSLCVPLSKQETRVALMLSQGYNIKSISAHLKLSAKKIQEIKREIKAKYLDAQNMTPP